MPRPSRNIDQRLLDSGLALLPETGCRGLSARKLAEHAGVNLGMFHYHFRNKENFIRILLEQTYEQMFSMLTLHAAGADSPRANLRNALLVLGRFASAHRRLLFRIAGDAMAGEAVAAGFLRTNIPRHVVVVMRLVAEAQQCGELQRLPLPQAMAFLAGAVVAPVLLGGALIEQSAIPAPLAAGFDAAVLSDEAIAQRIDLALRGLSPTKEDA